MPIRVRLVRPSLFLGMGYGLGLALFLAGLRYRLARSPRFPVAPAGAIVLFLLLPAGLRGLAVGPILAVLALATIALFELFRTQGWGKARMKTAAPVVLAITTFLGTTAITAQVSPFRLTPERPNPVIPVYLIAGPAESPEQQTVLLAPEALEKLRTQAGLSQRQLAKLVGTTASVICLLEDADYQGHSLSMLRRIATALDRRIEIRFVPVRHRSRPSESHELRP